LDCDIEREDESAALAGRAFHVDATVGLRAQLSAEVEAQASTLHALELRWDGASLAVGLEELPLVTFANPDALVFNSNDHLRLRVLDQNAG